MEEKDRYHTRCFQQGAMYNRVVSSACMYNVQGQRANSGGMLRGRLEGHESGLVLQGVTSVLAAQHRSIRAVPGC